MSSASKMRTVLVSALLLSAFAPASAQESKPRSCPKPEWPLEARRYELEGTTTLRFGMDEEGRVQDASVARSSRWELLDQAAIKSLKACAFGAELGKKAKGKRMPVQYVWSLDGGASAHPLLVEGSCAASERFARFDAGDKGVTGPDGVLVRLLVDKVGIPFGVKAEAPALEPELRKEAIAWVQSCRFAPDPAARVPHTDTVTGRVLLK